MPTLIGILLGIASLTLFLWFVAQGKFGETYGKKKSSPEEPAPEQASSDQRSEEPPQA